MIVVDSSALLAIIFDEPERQSFEDLSPRRAMPPVGGERARDSLRPSRAPRPHRRREAMAIAGGQRSRNRRLGQTRRDRLLTDCAAYALRRPSSSASQSKDYRARRASDAPSVTTLRNCGQLRDAVARLRRARETGDGRGSHAGLGLYRLPDRDLSRADRGHLLDRKVHPRRSCAGHRRRSRDAAGLRSRSRGNRARSIGAGAISPLPRSAC